MVWLKPANHIGGYGPDLISDQLFIPVAENDVIAVFFVPNHKHFFDWTGILIPIDALSFDWTGIFVGSVYACIHSYK